LRGLSAREAADKLGVNLATLYSYVSRGLIRSAPSGPSNRLHRYSRDDIERLRERNDERRDPSKVALHALNWGAPVLESALTLIIDGRLYYRGVDASSLARSSTAEAVAALLWTGSLDTSASLFAQSHRISKRIHRRISQLGALPLVDELKLALVIAGAEDPRACDLEAASAGKTSARVVRMLCDVLVFRSGAPAGPSPRRRIAANLALAWCRGNDNAARALDAALILCADYELNAPTFAARCAASAGSTPYEVALAGLAAMIGAKHGASIERADAMLAAPGNPRAVIRRLIDRAEHYGLHGASPVIKRDPPDLLRGDLRGIALLDLAAQAAPRSRAVVKALALASEIEALTGEPPSLDLGLAALRRALGLPKGTALALFVLGRTIGCLAHAIEQYQIDRVIRPRARYVGPAPG
jgi:citrate synthase